MAKRRGLSMVAFRVFQIGVIGLVVITAAGLAGAGPFSWLHHKSSPSAAVVITPETTAPGGPTTTTTFTIESRDYEKGQCVTWDQTSSADERSTTLVPCAKAHLLEIASKFEMNGDLPFPTDSDWDNIFARDCLPSVQALLSKPLDPDGRFTTGGIHPLLDGWIDGDRTIWCGVVAVIDSANAFAYAPFTGEAEGASQTRLDAVGTCFAAASPYPVPCTQPHRTEITGYVDLTGQTAPPPAITDDHGWEDLVEPKCGSIARTYVGHALTGNETDGWIPILAQSWTAGRRIAECTVARVDANNQAITIVGSLRG